MMYLETLVAWVPNGFELLVIMVIALLLFGKRLPEVARNLGRGVVEFKKGLRNVEDDLDPNNSPYQPPQRPQGQALPYSQEQVGQQQAAPQQPAPPPQAAPVQPAAPAPQSGEAPKS